MQTDEEGTVVSTVRGTNCDVFPIEVLERMGGGLILRQAEDSEASSEQILVDVSQLRKLWYVLGMHIELIEGRA